MSDDCFFNPDACVEPEPVVEPTEEAKPAEEAHEGDHAEDDLAEEWAEVEAWMEESSGDLFNAQLTFLLASGVMFTKALIDNFLYYHAADCTYNEVDSSTAEVACDSIWSAYLEGVNDYSQTLVGADWIDEDEITGNLEMGVLIRDWARFLIFGAAFVFQIMSMLGMMTGLNLMVWHYGVGLGGMIAHAIVAYFFITSAGYAWKDAAEVYEDTEDVDVTDALVNGIFWIQTGAANIAIMKTMAVDTALTLTLVPQMEMWTLAQWWALPEEERYAMWLEHRDDDEMFAKLH